MAAPGPRKTSKTRKKNVGIIKLERESIEREIANFRILYANRKNGILNSDRIQGRFPQKFIRDELADINKRLMQINNMLVKRKPDPQGFLDTIIPENETRAFKEFRGNKQIIRHRYGDHCSSQNCTNKKT